MGKGQTHISDISCACAPQELNKAIATMPCICGDRTFCGDLDIRIDTSGIWHYNKVPVTCPDMVKLLSSMLKLDEKEQHWLVTPTEVGRITVEDAPFVIDDFHVSGQGEEQIICVCTNTEDVVCLCEKSPLIIKPSAVTNQLSPYIIIGEGLSAKIPHDLFAQLKKLGATRTINDTQSFGLWSSSAFFSLGPRLTTHT